jgi:hypothetical protein
MGATLFSTPGLKDGNHISALVGLLIGLAVAFVPVVLILRRGPRRGPGDTNPEDGWGRGPKEPDTPRPDRPRGGIPLDDAAPARVRLRGKGRLADERPPRERRPAREPDRAPGRKTTPS